MEGRVKHSLGRKIPAEDGASSEMISNVLSIACGFTSTNALYVLSTALLPMRRMFRLLCRLLLHR